MDAKVTVSVRGLLVAGLVLLALLVAYLLGSAGRPGAPAYALATEQPQPDTRKVVMSGVGEATAVPDQVSFGLTVAVTRTDLDSALDATSGTMKRVLAALSEYDVARKDVQTTGLSMTPVYDYPQYAPPTIIGYRVSERAHVRIEQLRGAGKAIAAAIGAGGNDVRVGNVRLEVSDPDAVLAKAREAAVREATAKAQEYADATAETLGGVLSLKEVGPSPAQRDELMYRAAAYDSAEALKAVPIRAGEDELTVRVEIVWEFA
jgi:hypothetical protein